jgi:hypothetical protein
MQVRYIFDCNRRVGGVIKLIIGGSREPLELARNGRALTFDFIGSAPACFRPSIQVVWGNESAPGVAALPGYDNNAWGRTLASVYSVRPKPRATVSTPVGWEEVERAIRMEDFRIDNVPKRIHQYGDLWKPLLLARGRLRLERFL